jgi:hypothetical protein
MTKIKHKASGKRGAGGGLTRVLEGDREPRPATSWCRRRADAAPSLGWTGKPRPRSAARNLNFETAKVDNIFL